MNKGFRSFAPIKHIIMVKKFDFLVIGSGLAGMSFALKVAHKGKVALICKAGLEEANTYFAQGGIASVTNLKVDNFEKHIEDTMIAGDWISDRAAVEKSSARSTCTNPGTDKMGSGF